MRSTCKISLDQDACLAFRKTALLGRIHAFIAQTLLGNGYSENDVLSNTIFYRYSIGVDTPQLWTLFPGPIQFLADVDTSCFLSYEFLSSDFLS